MELAELERHLIESMGEWQIIDCHEHLGPERDRVARAVDVFTLFSQYTHGDLLAAGMSETDYQALYDQRIPLARRWAFFEPYWERIRWGSYARAVLLTVREFYGFDDINKETYAALSAAMQDANVPGIYERVLTGSCSIRLAITQYGSTDVDSSLFVPVMPMVYEMETWETLSHPAFAPAIRVRSLDDYLDAVRQYILRVMSEGAVGLKMDSKPYADPDREKALSAFKALRDGIESDLPARNPLRDYVVDQAISFAIEQNLVIAVHTGYWGDFRMRDPLHMIPILQRHPAGKFDIFHLGYPWVRETLMLGKGFPSVWLNLCWTHIISQHFAMDGLDEAIDLMPANKLMAFGGDYRLPVENVYGHLVMAREDVARVLAKRIKRGEMSERDALTLAHKWFWDNPKELYRLEV